MVEPLSTSNPSINSNASRKKKGRGVRSGSPAVAPSERWRSEDAHQIYSSKLIDTLRHIRCPDSPDAAFRANRDAADRVLANSAQGSTRWSRALLTHRFSLRPPKVKKKHETATRPGSGFRNSAGQTQQIRLRRKVRVLRRLVPGCRKLSLPSLIDETTDYIAALQMQLKALVLMATS